MALRDTRLTDLAARAVRGEEIPKADVAAVVGELVWWRAEFAALVTEALKLKNAADLCIDRLNRRHDREVAALRHQSRQLAQRAVIVLPDLDYDHDAEE